MPAAAPRYDRRLVEAARALDDRQDSMAETCRKVGAEADRLGLTRPSYVHLRRFIRAERERRRELDVLTGDIVAILASGRVPRLEPVTERVRELNLRAERRRSS